MTVGGVAAINCVLSAVYCLLIIIVLQFNHKRALFMRNNSSLVYSVFLVIGDFFALLAAFVVAYVLRVSLDPRPLVSQIHAVDYLLASLIVLPLWVLVHGLIGLYSQQIYEKRFVELGKLLIGSFLGILVVIGYDFITDGSLFPAHLVPVYGFCLAFLFLVITRTFARIIRTELFMYGIGITNLLIVGDTPLSIELMRQLANTKRSGYRIVGVVSKSQPAHGAYPKIKIFETFREAIEKIGVDDVQSIVQTELFGSTDKNNEILTTAQENHIAYRFVPGNAELFVGKIQVDLFRSVPVIAVHQTALLGWGKVVKRAFDVVVSLIAIIITSPIMFIIAILIKIEDGGSIFFRQTRLTRYNQKFLVYKFRSIKQAYSGLPAEEAFIKMGRPGLVKQFRANGNFLPNDPRNTRLGTFTRKTSLDELPQLFNVLKGDLSLVGPRALVPEDLAEYKKRHTILSVKSGITGLAQVSGRNNIPIEERRKLDVYYAQNWSFWLDLTILFKTFRVIITNEVDE